jgi:hypothetical protein
MSDWAAVGVVVVLVIIAYRLERILEHVRAIDAKLTPADEE